MGKRIIVGVTGKRRAGKDTFAGVLVREFGFRRVAFADALKAEVAVFLGLTAAELEVRKEDFRATLQEAGQARRRMDPRYWIKRVSAVVARHGYVVVPDVRYLNEAQWIHNRGGLIVRVAREIPIGHNHLDTHSSETQQDRIDVDYDERHWSVAELERHAREYARGIA